MRKVTLVSLLMLVSIVTSGCVKTVMRFNADGSGSLEIGLNLSIQDLQEAQEMSGEDTDDTDGLIALIETGKPLIDEETGIAVTAQERLENGSIWTYIIVNVPTLEAWELLNESTEDVLDVEDDELLNPDTLASVPAITIDGDTIRIEFKVAAPSDGNEEEDPFGMAAIMSAFFQQSYEIEMPGELIEHNGQIDTLTGNPVWLIDPTATEDIEVFIESALE